jgi:CheY-like chemotaxis protein
MPQLHRDVMNFASTHFKPTPAMSQSSQLLPRDFPARSVVRSLARVLIVDDEPHVLAVGKAVLEAHGFDAVTSQSGEEALELVRTGVEEGARFAVAILDLTMPGGSSGFEVLEWLRACDPRLPVIACSGYFQEDVRDLCRAIGFVDVLHKPFNIESLYLAVRRAMVQDADSGESISQTGSAS